MLHIFRTQDVGSDADVLKLVVMAVFAGSAEALGRIAAVRQSNKLARARAPKLVELLQALSG